MVRDIIILLVLYFQLVLFHETYDKYAIKVQNCQDF